MIMNYRQAVQEARERAGETEITDSAALALCQAWQSPGIVGEYLAAVASGAWSPESLRTDKGSDTTASRGELFRDDLYRTFKDEPDEDAMTIWSALGTWSSNGAAN